MKLEVGKRYRLRDGRIAIITNTNGSDAEFPIEGLIDEQKEIDIWQRNGSWGYTCQEDKDLVYEAIELNCVEMDPSSVSSNFPPFTEPKRLATVEENDHVLDVLAKSRRYRLAGQAMQGMLAASNGWPGPEDMGRVAFLARVAADALIAELEKTPEVKSAVE